jgi:hypothetical protein
MNEAFNPYYAFLGLDQELAGPNYYQLLRLRELEGDASKITAAAEKAMVRVRGQRPGQHAPEWSRLLDEIQAAKACLLDPAQKRAYDERLTQGQNGHKAKAPSPQPAALAPSAGPATSPQATNGYPPGMGPQPAAPVTANGGAPVGAAPNYAPQQASYAPQGYGPAPGMPNPAWNPAYPVSPAMQPMAPMPGNPAMMPVGQGWPGAMPAGYASAGMPQSPQPYDPMAPVAYSQAPAQPYGGPMGAYPATGMPGAYPMAVPTAMPVPQAAPFSAPTEGFASPTLVKGKPVKRRRSNGPLLLAGTVIGSIAVVGGVLMALNWKGEQGNKQQPQVAQNTQQVTPVAAPPTTPPVESKTPPRVEPEVPSTPMPPAENTRPKSPMVEEPTSTPAMKEPAEKMPKEPEPKEAMTLPTPPAPTPEKPATPSPEPTPTPAPASPIPETPEMKPPTREELVALTNLVKEARTALGDFQFAEADEALAKAEMLAKLPEHQERIHRLQNVSNLAKQFQEAVVRTMSGLSAGEVLKIGSSTEAAIVDASPTKLVIRLNGDNKTYSLENMPLGLAVNLGERSLNPNSPATRAAKGAYVFIDKRSDAGQRKKAQTWWEEAQLNGMDMRELMPVLTDKYDFTADAPKPNEDAE